MAEINRLVEANNLKAALVLHNSQKGNFDHLKRYSRLTLVVERFEEDFERDVQAQSRDFLLKNVRKVLEFVPKFAAAVSFSLRTNAPVERVQNAAMLELLGQTVELLRAVGNYDKLKGVFYDKFVEYLESAVLKGLDARNLAEKAVELFCFFVTYESFRQQVFNCELSQISLLRVEPRFVDRVKGRVQAAEATIVATFISALSKLGNMFQAFGLGELFLLFRELVDFSLSDYIEKSVTALAQGSRSASSDLTQAFRCEFLDRPEVFGSLIS